MRLESKKYLFDILECARFLEEFASGRTLEDYARDRGFRSAVERELQVIGEAMMQLARLAPSVAEQISEHRRIIGFRHILVHGYDSLDHELVWTLVQEKLPVLRAQVESLLPGESDRS